MNLSLTKNAYYAADIPAFLGAAPEAILGSMATLGGSAVETTQRDAWVLEITTLKTALDGLQGTIFLEYSVPRIGSRIDAVVLSGPVIFPIEFKVGEREFRRQDYNQVWDYGLDLKNFHKESHHAPIVPILVATEAPNSSSQPSEPHADGVYRPIPCNSAELGLLLRACLKVVSGPTLDRVVWANSPYQPTPTIIEAAQNLFAGHSVENIARSDAGAINLRVTSQRIEDIVDESRASGRKAIIFVTGVPGAGKTLVGLNIATRKREETEPTHAVFLSGNGPLVAVLREALTRDELERLKSRGISRRKGVIEQPIKAFIQNVHHFRDAGLKDAGPPSDHVVIFDEAQRAWNREATGQFMLRRKQVKGFDKSEPEFLLSYLDRHTDWAVVVCLVGGGQEINRGEAGISEWFDAVQSSFPGWRVYISPELSDKEYAAKATLDSIRGRQDVVLDEGLHLAVSMRSFRAENVSRFVKAVLDLDREGARRLLAEVSGRYPIALTRSLVIAKRWARAHARGSERYGLVASSGAQRLKPHAIDVRVDINPVHWFLNTADDTRSSFYLEDAATEFQVQGLELDWVCVTWDADLRLVDDTWSYHSFKGTSWKAIHKLDLRGYLINAYRVLLTRARQGMVICVPEGETADPTRDPAYYDATFDYLAEVGIPVLK